MQSSFWITATEPRGLPSCDTLSEVAVVGRSNAGKSSLLNALTGRPKLARTSRTPGRTQEVHFFRFEKSSHEAIILVDLPGYGYNVASQATQRRWAPLIEQVLARSKLETVLFVMDCRRDLEPFELRFLAQHSAAGQAIWVILTKTDKVAARQWHKKQAEIEGDLARVGVRMPRTYPVSSLRRGGIERLRHDLFDALQR